jgi:hypothetical protein
MNRLLVFGGFALATACGPSRAEQCSALIEKINTTSRIVSHSGSAAAKRTSMSNLAATIDRATSELRTMPLREASLRRERDEYAQTLSRISVSLTVMQDALDNNRAPSATREVLDRIQAEAREESAAVERINRECRPH